MYTIGDRIRFFRHYRCMTADQLGLMSGIHPVSIRRYETNKMTPQPQQIAKLAEVLSVNPRALTDTEDDLHAFTTVGEMLGALISFHKSGLITIKGERTERPKNEGYKCKDLLKKETVYLSVHPSLSKYLSVLKGDSENPEDIIPIEKVKLNLDNKTFLLFLKWECAYFHYHHFMDNLQPECSCLDDNGEEAFAVIIDKKEYNKMYTDMVEAEMQLQADSTPLDF